jgi:hypothetical protein
MKDVFLVHITLPDIFTPKFWELVPKQTKRINEKAVMDILSTFPIIKEVKTNIHELAFYDAAPLGMPDIIMN